MKSISGAHCTARDLHIETVDVPNKRMMIPETLHAPSIYAFCC